MAKFEVTLSGLVTQRVEVEAADEGAAVAAALATPITERNTTHGEYKVERVEVLPA
jgi:hypothetical protein